MPKKGLEVGITRSFLCLPVQQTLSECQATFQSWRILLQGAHDGVPAKVPQPPGRRAAINALIVVRTVFLCLVEGLSWSSLTLKACKSWLANCSGPPKACPTSKTHSSNKDTPQSSPLFVCTHPTLNGVQTSSTRLDKEANV